jgi:pimeloyl-ACP methyl ester carboxylesterase
VGTFVLVPGAGGTASYWYRVVPLLEAGGHRAIAVELPGDDESAGLPEYTSLVIAAIGGRPDVVLVAQSMGAFTAPMVCARAPVSLLVLVNAMIPRPGETMPGRKRPASPRPGTAGTRPSSIWTPISCMTCPPKSWPRERRPAARRQASRSASPATSTSGPPFPPG